MRPRRRAALVRQAGRGRAGPRAAAPVSISPRGSCSGCGGVTSADVVLEGTEPPGVNGFRTRRSGLSQSWTGRGAARRGSDSQNELAVAKQGPPLPSRPGEPPGMMRAAGLFKVALGRRRSLLPGRLVPCHFFLLTCGEGDF